MTLTSTPSELFIPQRLDFLFRHVRKADGEFSYDEVERGTKITAAYISRLRRGVAQNPSVGVITALANFFRVDPSYFVEYADGKSDEALGRLYAAKRLHNRLPLSPTLIATDATLEQIALHASELNDTGRQALLGMLQYILSEKGGVQSSV